MKNIVRAILLTVALVAVSAAQSTNAATIRIDNAWAEQNGKRGAVFLTISNSGAASDQLYAIKTSVAKMAVLHTGEKKAGDRKMRRMMALVIAPGEKVRFQTGDRHIMLMGLKQPLRKGDTIPLKLFFKKAGAIEVDVQVK